VVGTTNSSGMGPGIADGLQGDVKMKRHISAKGSSIWMHSYTSWWHSNTTA